MKPGLIVIIATVAVCAIASAIVLPLSMHYRGIYGSLSFSQGQVGAIHSMTDNYGHNVLAGAEFAKPNVINTHLQAFNQHWTKTNIIRDLSDNSQVRIFHIIGRRGIKYCVGEWDWSFGRAPYYGKYFITKGCRF